MMTVPCSRRTGSSNVARRVRSRRSGMNAVSVLLLMATSSVTGSSVGARDKASATGMTSPGLYVSWYEYSCDDSSICCSGLRAFPGGFVRVASSGLCMVTSVCQSIPQ